MTLQFHHAGGGFKSRRGLLPEKAQTTLRNQRPEKQPGGFRSRAPCTCFSVAGRGYSFPSVRFGGRPRRQQHMHDTDGTEQEYRHGGGGR